MNAGVDTTVIALWLGHESVATTQIYVHADLALKERALARTTPMGTPPGRYQPTDTIVEGPRIFRIGNPLGFFSEERV